MQFLPPDNLANITGCPFYILKYLAKPQTKQFTSAIYTHPTLQDLTCLSTLKANIPPVNNLKENIYRTDLFFCLNSKKCNFKHTKKLFQKFYFNSAAITSDYGYFDVQISYSYINCWYPKNHSQHTYTQLFFKLCSPSLKPTNKSLLQTVFFFHNS